MLENQLKQLGFNKNEVIVYLALFDLGKCKAGQIIEHTGLHRNLVYTALEELEKRSLISKVEKQGVYVFMVNDPGILLAEINEKKNLVSNIVEELQKRQSGNNYEVHVYEGFEGVKQARDKTLQMGDVEGDTLYVIGGSKKFTTPDMETYWRNYHRRREKAGVKYKILFDQNTDPEVLSWRNNLQLSQARYLPYSMSTPTEIDIFKDMVNIAMPGSNPLTFHLRNKEIAEGFKQYFNFFWNQRVFVESGIEALKRKTYEMLEELNSGEEYYCLGASSGNYNADVQKLYDKFHEDRIKKGVITNMLVYRESYDQIKTRFEKCGDPDGKVSYLKMFISAPPTPMQINLYKNKVFFIFYGEEPTVFTFDQAGVYEVFKQYFDNLWNQEVVVEEGVEAVKKFFNSMLEELEPGDTYYVLGTSVSQELSREINNFLDEYHAKRINKGVKVHMLAFREYFDQMTDRIRRCGDPKFQLSFIKNYTSSSPTPLQITLYNNKVSLMTLGEKPAVIYLARPDLYEGFKVHFDKEWNQESYVLRGVEVIRDIWLESLKTKELKFVGGRGYFVDRCPQMAEEILAKAKRIRGLKWKNVVDSGSKGHRLNNLPWMEARYNLKDAKNPNVIWLWGEKAAVANWTEAEPVVFITTNKHLVQSYRDYFDELWNRNS